MTNRHQVSRDNQKSALTNHEIFFLKRGTFSIYYKLWLFCVPQINASFSRNEKSFSLYIQNAKSAQKFTVVQNKKITLSRLI